MFPVQANKNKLLTPEQKTSHPANSGTASDMNTEIISQNITIKDRTIKIYNKKNDIRLIVADDGLPRQGWIVFGFSVKSLLL